MKIILVDDISSISESIFSFKYKKSVIKEDPFVCKQKPEKNGTSTYHLDEIDLRKINVMFPEIFPYSDRVAYKEYKDLSKNQYINLMKPRLYQLIVRGQLVDVLTMLTGRNMEGVAIRWDESKPGIE
ncbi:MAG: hypothetical protein ACE3JP_14205 [Ectobacillus sp.]